jgi:hypothetical protein
MTWERMERTVEFIAVLTARFDELARRFDELVAVHKGTEERLNSFITFVEKYIRKGD